VTTILAPEQPNGCPRATAPATTTLRQAHRARAQTRTSINIDFGRINAQQLRVGERNGSKSLVDLEQIDIVN
jgi:hypothetical protein